MTDLQTRLLAAHHADDHQALCLLYTLAADSTQNRTEAAFFLTQAYVFALEGGLASAETLRDRLIGLGCEAP